MRVLRVKTWALLGCLLSAIWQVKAEPQDATSKAELLTKENVVDASRPNGIWSPATIGQQLAIRDLLRTGELSRASLRLTNLAVLRVNELTTLEILPPEQVSQKPKVDLKAGAVYFFSREKPQEIQIQTPVATGALRGTEFHCYVAPSGRTSLTVLEGQVELSNSFGRVLVNSGEQGNVEPGQAPTKTVVIEAINIIQWCLYYPGFLDVRELGLPNATRTVIGDSLRAYQSGDLLTALKLYPKGRIATSRSERIYRAGLLLSVGQVDKANAEVALLGNQSDAEAIRQLIAAVKFQDYQRTHPLESVADWITESYYQQSRSNLEGALKAARSAAKKDPTSGFAWTRIAELEFSFGHTQKALEALMRGIDSGPRNAQAYALRGFLLSARNEIDPARESFNQAIELDGALGNAWLGRGLCAIRQGKAAQGREDLLTAAALEPNRSFLRSYLGKAFANTALDGKARREFDLAKQLDPHDPTPWLYSAIENKKENRINQAVDDLETSVRLNECRRVYRSQFLLDQDRAVRSANLASIYQANGMEDQSVREATRAVNFDYSNPSAHLFLANSYNALRDPQRIILRYETPWFNELLISNLLSPVGGGPLSQYVSQQEYSKLFENNRLGLASSTDYYSTGELRETASQYGLLGNFSYALDTEYHYDNGIRPNNKISRLESYAQVKLQLTPEDTLFFQTKFQDTRNGDVLQHYYNRKLTPGADTYLPDFHFSETQTPALLLLGYHHEWYPGIHTLILVGRLADNLSESQTIRSLIATRDFFGDIIRLGGLDFDIHYHSNFETYTSELQQIFQSEWNTFLAGGRFQSGEFETWDLLDFQSSMVRNEVGRARSGFGNPPANQDASTLFQRGSLYAYDFVQPWRWLSLSAGASYDQMIYPRNFREPPILEDSTFIHLFSPKAGFTLTPFVGTTLRGAYTRSLGGTSFDGSILLEPTQIDGFTQTYRTIINENILGEAAAPKFAVSGLALEQKLSSKTYFGLEFTKMNEELRRQNGAFDFKPDPNHSDTSLALPGFLHERIAYEEKHLSATLNQLVGRDLSIGIRYTYSSSRLHRVFPDVPVVIDAGADRVEQAQLNQLQLFAIYNHPCGFFARSEALWCSQQNDGYGFRPHNVSAEPGDDFWQFNTYLGWRFRQNLGELSIGLLNLTGRDYNLNPLNLYTTLPRDREVLMRVKFNF